MDYPPFNYTQNQLEDFISNALTETEFSDNIEEDIIQFSQWVSQSISNAVMLNMLYNNSIKVSKITHEYGIEFALTEEFKQQNPQFQGFETNPIWQQISEVLVDKEL